MKRQAAPQTSAINESVSPDKYPAFGIEGNRLKIYRLLNEEESRQIMKKTAEMFHSQLIAYAMRYTHNLADAEDVVAEVYLKFYKRLLNGKNFKYPTDIYYYLSKAIINTFIDNHRGKKKESSLNANPDTEGIAMGEFSLSSFNPETLLSRKELSPILFQTIADVMPKDFYRIYLMRELEGMTYEEIAGECNIPMGTVMSRLFRARLRLVKVREKLTMNKIDNAHDDLFDNAA